MPKSLEDSLTKIPFRKILYCKCIKILTFTKLNFFIILNITHQKL